MMEMLAEIRLPPETMLLLKRFSKKGIHMLTGTTCNEAIDKGLRIVTREGAQKTIDADTIALTTVLPPTVVEGNLAQPTHAIMLVSNRW